MLGLAFLRFLCAAPESPGPSRPGGNRGGAENEAPGSRGFPAPDSAVWDRIFPPGQDQEDWQDSGREAGGGPGLARAIAGAIRAIGEENPALRDLFPGSLSRPQARRAPERDPSFLPEFGRLLGGLSAAGAGQVFTGLLEEFEKAASWSRQTWKDTAGGPAFQVLPEAPVPPRIAALIALMLEPFRGRFFDPCCGSAGLSAGAADFVSARQGKLSELAFYGQERRAETWRLARMNLMVRGADAGGILLNAESPLQRDLQGDIKFDFIAACPPAEENSCPWIRYTLDRLSPAGLGALILPRSSLNSPRPEDRELRRSLVEGRLLDCVVRLPARIFSSHSAGPSVWLFSRAKISRGRRSDEVLFIDSRNLGRPLDRRHWEFSAGDVNRIARTYHNWRFPKTVPYRDLRSFAVSVHNARIREAGYSLNPALYLGLEEEEEETGQGAHFAALRAEFEALIREEARISRRTAESLRKIREEDLR
jgi:type I restriction enzyme M protein